MLAREERERQEDLFLAPYAVHAKNSRGRNHPEEEHPYRTAFQRDKDRIIFSSPFRRLQDKAQVFSNIQGSYYRTRLTHTFEVSQIARSIARSLRLNEDLSEAIACGHDLGHGPFGHIGERILNECMASCGGFEHNEQSLRIVEKLENIYFPDQGLNLTWETRQGLKKHSFELEDQNLPDSYHFLEAQVVDLADEIAYASHDLDDGLRARLLRIEDIEKLRIWNRIDALINERHPVVDTYQRLHLIARFLINIQVTDLIEVTEKNIDTLSITSLDDINGRSAPVVAFSEALADERKELKDFLFKNFYRNKEVMGIVHTARGSIQGLFHHFQKNHDALPKYYVKRIEAGEDDPRRIICDYIAGMTDLFAFEESRRLIGG